MGRKNSPSAKKELTEIIQRYEAAKAEKRQLYLDGDQLADIADWYATERKFNDAQEVINYGLHYGICPKDSNSMKSDNPNSGFYKDMAISCYDGVHGSRSESHFPLGYYDQRRQCVKNKPV